MENKFFEDMLSSLEKEAENLKDQGHIKIMNDLIDLVKRVSQGKYHDFHKNGETFPKRAFVEALEALKHNAIHGMYDN